MFVEYYIALLFGVFLEVWVSEFRQAIFNVANQTIGSFVRYTGVTSVGESGIR